MGVVNFPNGFGHLKSDSGNPLADLELRKGISLRILHKVLITPAYRQAGANHENYQGLSSPFPAPVY